MKLTLETHKPNFQVQRHNFLPQRKKPRLSLFPSQSWTPLGIYAQLWNGLLPPHCRKPCLVLRFPMGFVILRPGGQYFILWLKWKQLLIHTLEKIGCKACFIDRAIRHKLHPHSVGAGLYILWLLIATEVANQGALFRRAVADFQVVVCTAVVSFDLNGETETTWKTAAWP